jgi:hypothetical protein
MGTSRSRIRRAARAIFLSSITRFLPPFFPLALAAPSPATVLSRMTRSRPTATQLGGNGLFELQAPLPDSFVAYPHASLGHQLFDIAIAQGESVIQPYAVADDLARKTVTPIQG